MKTVIPDRISNFLPHIFKGAIPVKKGLDIDCKKVNFPSIKNPHDFVQIPGTGFVISKYEMSGLERGCFRDGTEQMNARGINMATPYLFLMHLYNLLDCENQQTPVLDAIGNAFSSSEVNDMLHVILGVSISATNAYQGGIWLGPEYGSSDIKNPFALGSLVNRLSEKAISNEQSIFVKDGLVNYGPVSAHEGKFLGGTGEGDGFMFYSVGDELYLDFKCNPIIINENPKIYGVLEENSFHTNLSLTESNSIILNKKNVVIPV
jgi:hypothetical protein